MNLLLAFYIIGAVLNCVLMVMLREAFVENGKSNSIWLVATIVLTLMSLGVTEREQLLFEKYKILYL